MEAISADIKSFSIDEYLAFEQKTAAKHMYFNGKIFAMSGATPKHNQINARLIHCLISLLDEEEQGYQVLTSDTRIYIEKENTFLYPDAVVICKEPVFFRDSSIAIINPLLIIEILSDSTAEYDRGEKFFKYRHLETFKEYVLVHQDKPMISSFFQKEEKIWQETTVEGLDQKLYLPALDVSLNLNAVYKNVKFT